MGSVLSYHPKINNDITVQSYTFIHVHVLCCFALFVCLILLASFFLPSHLSFKNMYMCSVNVVACTCTVGIKKLPVSVLFYVLFRFSSRFRCSSPARSVLSVYLFDHEKGYRPCRIAIFIARV